MDEEIMFEDATFTEYGDLSFENTTNGVSNTILYDGMKALLAPSLQAKSKAFITHCATYIDRNADSLVISAPYKKLLFIETRDSDPIFPMYNASKNDIKAIIKQSPQIYQTFRTLNNPLFFILTGLNIMYREDAKNALSREAASYASLFMALRFYSSRQGHLLPYENDYSKDIMEYTINHITEKFLIRKEKTILGVLKYIATDNDENLGDRLLQNPTDQNFKNYITNLSTRINNFLRNILTEYRKNMEEQNYIGESKERYNDENQNLREIANASSEIYDLTLRVYTKLKTSPLDSNILKIASSNSKMSATTIQNTISNIFKNEMDDIKKVITYTLQLFLAESKNKIEHVKSKYFMIYCLKVYRISNTVNPTLEAMKKILDDWMKIYGSQYLRLNRAATKSAFRKSMFVYIVAAITKYA